MARSCRLTCLKMEGTNLLKKIKVLRPTTLISAYDPALGWA